MTARLTIKQRIAQLEDDAHRYELDAQLYTARANEATDVAARASGLHAAQRSTMQELRVRGEIEGLHYALLLLPVEVAS